MCTILEQELLQETEVTSELKGEFVLGFKV